MSKSNSSFKVKTFPFYIRQAEQVARAIAGTLVPFPSVLSVGGERLKDGVANIFFRFEGKMFVTISLFNMGHLTESWRTQHVEDWVVIKAESVQSILGPRFITQFDAAKLEELREKGLWNKPKVMSIDDICGEVGIFFDALQDRAYIQTDPDYNSDGHSTLQGTVKYKILVPGDLKRAREEAIQQMNAIFAGAD